MHIFLFFFFFFLRNDHRKKSQSSCCSHKILVLKFLSSTKACLNPSLTEVFESTFRFFFSTSLKVIAIGFLFMITGSLSLYAEDTFVKKKNVESTVEYF